MKRVVFFFFLFTLSSAYHIFDHDHRIKSDGAETSTIILPTESSPVPDHTKSQEDLDRLKQMNRIPIQLKPGFNRYHFKLFRSNPHRCRHHRHRLNRNPPRFIGVNEVGAAPVRDLDRNNVDLNLNFNKDDRKVVIPAESRVLRHFHVARNFPEVEGDELLDQFIMTDYIIPHYRNILRHRQRKHNDEEGDQRIEEKTEYENDQRVEYENDQRVEVKTEYENDQRVEVKTEAEAVATMEEDHEHENREKHLLKKIGKFLGYF